MTAYVVRWDLEVDGRDPVDAAAQAITALRDRAGRLTLAVRQAGEDTEWEMVLITVPGIGI